jgi:ABC-type multidrug transport system fused ATPase/permease subunit
MCVYRLYNPIIQMTRAAAASKEIFAIIDAKVSDPTGKKGISIDQDIVFRNVTFAYPTRPDAIILDDLNVKFERGKNTAIVGPSGCGKSTIVAMLERWYQPSETLTGAQYTHGMGGLDDKPSLASSSDHEPTRGIYIGSNLIRELDVKWWRSNIGLVQQEPFLFNDTIYNNVAYGLVGTIWEEAPEEEKRSLVKKACQESYADEFISRLPQGYDTRVGEGGGMLISGGQRQRVAIARAIIKQPKILILDEATSSIDIRAERIVQKALDRVSRSRTTVTIAHRLATIKKADKIVVLRDGKVVEEGTHEQLLQIRGVYKALVQAQDIGAGAGDAEDLNIEISDAVELGTLAQTTTTGEKQVGAADRPADEKKKSRGFFRSFGFLLYEQRSHWILYALTVMGAMGGGGMALCF